MNVIFDIGKVLIDFDYEERVRSQYDAQTAEAVIQATWKNPDWIELDRGVLSVEEVLRKFIAKAPDCEKQIRCTFARVGEIPKLRPTTIPLIERIKKTGSGVYFLSNYFRFLIHTCPWVLEFTDYMDGGIFSCDVNAVKPDKEIYMLLCERYSLDPADCVFIDDSLINVKGAEAVGMRAIHYTGQTPDELIREIFPAGEP